MSLLVIVPTRNRPGALEELQKSFEGTCSGDSTLLAVVDDDDPRLEDYKDVATSYSIDLWVGPRLRLGATLNAVAVAQCADYDNLGFMGDDHRPRTYGWDSSYETALESSLFVYGDDLLQGENLPTQVAMRSSVVEALGYMCPPGLIHMFLDNAWKEWGQGVGSISYLPNIIVEHLHPAAGKASEDSGYTEVWNHMDSDSYRWQQYLDNGQLSLDISKLRELV